MKCCVCDKDFEQAKRGRPSKYCSKTCAKRAERLRRKIGALPASTKSTPAQSATTSEHDHDIPLAKHAFEARMQREMDESLETTLRRNRAQLQQAMDDPDTNARDLPAISRQLIAVSRELLQITGASTSIDLFADDDEGSEASYDSADLGAEII